MELLQIDLDKLQRHFEFAQNDLDKLQEHSEVLQMGLDKWQELSELLQMDLDNLQCQLEFFRAVGSVNIVRMEFIPFTIWSTIIQESRGLGTYCVYVMSIIKNR